MRSELGVYHLSPSHTGTWDLLSPLHTSISNSAITSLSFLLTFFCEYQFQLQQFMSVRFI